jgi:hypothetical protein
MVEIVIPKTKDPHNVDAEKDCCDFIPLCDGTIHGDSKYCNLSTQCRQYDKDKNMGYYSEFHEWEATYIDENGNKKVEKCRDYLCTGKFPIWFERMEDSKAS